MAKKSRKNAVTTPAAVIAGLKDSGDRAVDDAAKIVYLVQYLRHRRAVAGGLAGYVDYIRCRDAAGRAGCSADMAAVNGFIRDFGLDDSDVLAILLAHVEQVEAGAKIDIAGFFRGVLDPPEDPSGDDLPGQIRLPLGGPEEKIEENSGLAAQPEPLPYIQKEEATNAEPKPKTRKPRTRANWTGKWVRYRADRRTVIGRVTADSGDTIAIEDEEQAPWSNLSKKRCQVLKEDPTQNGDLAPASPAGTAPTTILELPADVGRRYGDALTQVGSFDDQRAGNVLLESYSAPLPDDHVAHLDIMNGTPGKSGIYALLYVLDGVGELAYAHPPISQLAGVYRFAFGAAEHLLEVRVEEENQCLTATA